MRQIVAALVSLVMSLFMAGCVTHADLHCELTPLGWQCDGGGGGPPAE